MGKYFNTRNPYKKRSRAEEKEIVMLATFQTMMILSMTVLHDKFGFGGKTRLFRYCEEIKKLFDAWHKGLIEIEDLQKVLEDECGIKITM